MANTDAQAGTGPGHRSGRRACRASLAALLAASAAVSAARSQPLSALELGDLGATFGTVVWVAVTAGTALAALAAFSLFMRGRRDGQLAAAQTEIMALRTALDRAEAMLGADDQRTVVWDSAAAPPQVFGGLPERAGAPTDKAGFLAFDAWLGGDGAAQIDSAVDRLRRQGEGFQLAVRTLSGSMLDVAGRTSGRRSLVRFRELTGERRSFAELKEQAIFVVNEMTALRALADLLPVPLWRRNRTGRLTWVNAAYARAVEAASPEAVLSAGVELLASRTREAIREKQRAGSVYEDRATAIVAGERRRQQIYDRPIEDGSVGCAIDMAELDATRDELRRTLDSSARILDQLTAGVASFGKNGRLLFHNAAFRAIFNLRPDWLTPDLDESAILDQLRADRKLPEQVNYRDWRAKHLAGYRMTEPREDWWHLPDGRTLRVVALPAGEAGMTYVYENLTEQLALEGRLKALLQLQTETLDHLTEAVAVFGTDGRLRLFNPVFAEIWRLSPARLRAEPHIGGIIAECQALYADKPTWDAIRAAATHLDHAGEAVGRMQRPDGSVIDFATVALPEGMTMLTFVDVTDSARVQRVLSERNEALEAADRLKSEFIQHVSYELRSPLTNIIGQTEMIANETFGALNAKQREYMGDIASSSAALLAIINDILDLATVDAGIMSLDIREADVGAVAAAAVEGLRDRLNEQRITLDMAIPPAIGTFHVDASRVRQILFNLVANAIRFSNAGGHVRLAAERSGPWVVYTVTDNGVGIPAEIMPTVFEPFEAHGSQGRRSGAGLGLSIVRSLVELHGGEVEIRSVEGEGTIATVRLPVVPAAIAQAAE